MPRHAPKWVQDDGRGVGAAPDPLGPFQTAKVAVVAGATAVRVSGALADVVLAANYLSMRQGYGEGTVNVNADGGTAWVVLRRPAMVKGGAK
jgi:hypothetical protein